MWVKYNPTSKLYEVSTNDGATWANLLLDAAQIGQGVFNDARLSSNIPRLASINNYSKTQRVTGYDITGATGGAIEVGYSANEGYLQAYDRTASAWKPIHVDGSVLISNAAIRERGRTIPMGEWIDVTYNSTNHTASGAMTWTVEAADQIVYSYTLLGKTMFMVWTLNNTSVGGTLGQILYLKIPGGFTCKQTVITVYRAYDAGVDGQGIVVAPAGDTRLMLQKFAGANWGNSNNATSVQGMIFFPLDL